MDIAPGGLACILSSAVRAALHCTLPCQQVNTVHLLLAPFGSKTGNKGSEKERKQVELMQRPCHSPRLQEARIRIAGKQGHQRD